MTVAGTAEPLAAHGPLIWPALGTTAVLCINDGPVAEVRAAVEREIAAIDAAASRFRADSELSWCNRAAGSWCRITPLLAEAVALALRAAELSGGAVDPTLGEALAAAGYDRDWAALEHPPEGAPLRHRRIVVARRRRDLWRSIELRLDLPAIRLPEGVSLDLGATAKALAADRAARAGLRAGAAGVLVALGGDIATAGAALRGGWRVYVTDDHRDGLDAPGQTVAISSGGLATSSLTTRRWLRDGETMHHILDPRTGRPVRPVWRTASVTAGSCADANIAATAAIVLGEQAERWLADQGLPARLVDCEGEVHTQGGWPR